MRIIYEGKDITNLVNINKADFTDNAGSFADSLDIQFDDPEGIWSRWKPKKNDKVEINHGSFKSGLMFIDELEQQRGMFKVRALSVPQESKSCNTQVWEAVRFMEFASEIAARYGFKLETYGTDNCLYGRVDQFEKADFQFLSDRCLLEGYMLKVTDGKVCIYSEAYMEGMAAAKTISLQQFDGSYDFRNTSTGIYNSCSISCGSIKARFVPSAAPAGAVLKYTDIYIASQGEGERYAKNLLRAQNKYESTGRCSVELDSALAAGNSINIKGVGLADGKYFCSQVTHKFMDKKTTLKLRKPLEGY